MLKTLKGIIRLIKKLIEILSLRWMSKDVVIRIFLLQFIIIIFLRIKTGGIDNELVGIVVVQISALIGLKTIEKIKGGK